jgi:voltage-gated potassium channel
VLILSEGDVVIVMGHRGDIPQFVRKHVIRRPMRYASSRLFRHDN